VRTQESADSHLLPYRLPAPVEKARRCSLRKTQKKRDHTAQKPHHQQCITEGAIGTLHLPRRVVLRHKAAQSRGEAVGGVPGDSFDLSAGGLAGDAEVPTVNRRGTGEVHIDKGKIDVHCRYGDSQFQDIEGIPFAGTDQKTETSQQTIFRFRWRINNASTTPCDRRVASAAPLTPITGKGPTPKIKSGSSTILITNPVALK